MTISSIEKHDWHCIGRRSKLETPPIVRCHLFQSDGTSSVVVRRAAESSLEKPSRVVCGCGSDRPQRLYSQAVLSRFSNGDIAPKPALAMALGGAVVCALALRRAWTVLGGEKQPAVALSRREDRRIPPIV
jgi:hypothetical protein